MSSAKESATGTRSKILEIAYKSFAEKGYGRTSMGAIAEEIGITRPALYYHFSSKEDLLLATYQTIDPLINVSIDEVLSSATAKEFLAAFDALIASITDNFHDDEQRARFVATVESASGQIPAVLESARAQYEATCTLLEQAIEHGKNLGALPTRLDTNTAAQFLSTYIYGVGEIMLRGIKMDTEGTRALALNSLHA